MSYEESLRALAESNAKLAAANLQLAESMSTYAATIEKYSTGIVSAATGVTVVNNDPAPADKPAKATRGKAGKVAEPEKKKEPEDDGFDDDGEEAETALDYDTVKASLMQVKDKFGDKSHALAIIKEYGYNALAEIQEKDYADIYADAQKKLKK